MRSLEDQLFQTRGGLVAVLLGMVIVPFIVAGRAISRGHHDPGVGQSAPAKG